MRADMAKLTEGLENGSVRELVKVLRQIQMEPNVTLVTWQGGKWPGDLAEKLDGTRSRSFLSQTWAFSGRVCCFARVASSETAVA